MVDRVDVADMLALHRGLRREFRLMPRLVDSVTAGDRSRARAVDAHLEMELASLHNHHEGEDAALWPALLATGAVSPELTTAMETQHAELDVVIGDVHQARTAWSADAAAAGRDRLAERLRDLSPMLDAHLDAEESEALPMVELHLTVEDWSRLGDESRRRLPSSPREQLLLLGVLLEDADAHEREVIAAQMPAVARLVWKVAGHPYYRRYVKRLRQPE